MGWILKHRRALTIGYLVCLHLVVYYSLTHGLFGELSPHTHTIPHHPVCPPCKCAGTR